jgi:aldose sugar dehydrogenase
VKQSSIRPAGGAGWWRRGALVLVAGALVACGSGAGAGSEATVIPGGTVAAVGTRSAIEPGQATTTPRVDTGGAPTATARPTAIAPTAPPATAPTAVPTTAPTVTPPAPTAAPAVPAGPVAFRVEEAATGLDTPWELAFAPDGRIFVTERPGRLRVIEGGQLRAEPVAAVPGVVEQGEGGLLGLALDPDFANNGGLYLYHTYREGGGLRNRVVRYILQDRTGARGLTGEQVIIAGIPGASTHNGGRIAFGPDGKLYVTTGDAQQMPAAQDRASLAGKILRLNPDGSIPADNPFPGSPVYSYGHRNPQGLAWQPGTGQLYATEHGPSSQDEVNRIVAGGNYGWPDARGTEGNREGLIAPVLASGASTTWAPSGATFTRTPTFPQWQGGLLFAGLRSTTLWFLALPPGGAPQLQPILEDEYGRLRAVQEGPDGAIYVLTSSQDGRGRPEGGDDRLLRLVPQR